MRIEASETEIKRAILDYLAAIGIFAWPANVGAAAGEYKDKRGRTKKRFVRFGFPGISDIIGTMPDGTFLAIEVKRPGRPPTFEQCTFLDRIKRNRGLAIVATSVDDVMAAITRVR